MVHSHWRKGAQARGLFHKTSLIWSIFFSFMWYFMLLILFLKGGCHLLPWCIPFFSFSIHPSCVLGSPNCGPSCLSCYLFFILQILLLRLLFTYFPMAPKYFNTSIFLLLWWSDCTHTVLSLAGMKLGLFLQQPIYWMLLGFSLHHMLCFALVARTALVSHQLLSSVGTASRLPPKPTKPGWQLARTGEGTSGVQLS